MKTKTIKIYDFSELSEEAQENAIKQLRAYRARVGWYDDDAHDIIHAIRELRCEIRDLITSDREDWQGMKARYWFKKADLCSRMKDADCYPTLQIIEDVKDYIFDCDVSVGWIFERGLDDIAEKMIENEYYYHNSDDYLREQLESLELELDKEGNLI